MLTLMRVRIGGAFSSALFNMPDFFLESISGPLQGDGIRPSSRLQKALRRRLLCGKSGRLRFPKHPHKENNL